MPPSGYSTQQSDLVRRFLRSCAEALEAEAKRDGISFSRGLDREIHSIARHLKSSNTDVVQSTVLQLTEAFYREVRRSDPTVPADYWSSVNKTVEKFGSQILQIEVTPVAG